MVDTKKITRRGRPRQFDAEAAEQTALRLFHERGYDGVSVAELGEAMGIAPPSFYAAFGSKMQLFERVLVRYARSDAPFMEEALGRDGPVETLLVDLLTEAAKNYTRKGQPCGCLIQDGTRNCSDPQVCALTHDLRHSARDRIRDRVAVDRPKDAGQVADYTMMVLAGLSAAARDGMPRRQLLELARLAGRAYRSEGPLSSITDRP